jgi:tRNA A37 threonylcarbamoyladenosine biosynthesis protein TsaE
LKKLALSVLTDTSIFIEGSLGSGKTVLVEHLAQMNKKNLLKCQMDESMDSKVTKTPKKALKLIIK